MLYINRFLPCMFRVTGVLTATLGKREKEGERERKREREREREK